MNWFQKIWNWLFRGETPTILTLARPEPVTRAVVVTVPEWIEPIRAYTRSATLPALKPSFKHKVYSARALALNFADEFVMLCNDATLEELKDFMSFVTNQTERDILNAAIVAKMIETETPEERFYRMNPLFGTDAPEAIIEPAGCYEPVQGDPNHTVDKYPHPDVIRRRK